MRPALCCVRLVDPAVPCSARPLTDSVAQEEGRKVLSQLHSSALSRPLNGIVVEVRRPLDSRVSVYMWGGGDSEQGRSLSRSLMRTILCCNL